MVFWLAALVMSTAVQLGYADEPPPASQAEALPEAQAIKEEMFEVASRLVRQFPRDSMPLRLLAEVHSRQGNTTEAVVLWKRCLELNPRRADICDCLATVALKRGDNDEAIALWRKAIQIDPHMDMAYGQMAWALMREGKTREVIEFLEKHVAVNEQADLSHYQLGQAYLQLKEYEKAKRHYLAAVALRPESYPAYYGLAKIAFRQGDSKAAVEYRKQFARHKTEFVQTQDDKLQAYDDTQSLRQTLARTYTDAGQIYHNHDDLWQAEKRWKKAAATDPANVVCRQRLAALYQSSKRPEEAVEMFKELVALEPEKTSYYLNMGVTHARLKNFEAAEKAFQKVCELDPESFTGFFSLAQFYLQENMRLKEAQELSEKAVKLSPIAPNYFILSWACRQNADLPRARAAIRRALELDPGNPRYRKMQELVQGKP